MIKKAIHYALCIVALALFTIACSDDGTEPAPPPASNNAYVTKLFEYRPAPGQFINNNPGNLESATGVLCGKSGMVSLGAWGGYVVFGFDHTVVNQPNTDDIIVYGNAMTTSAEPGIIWVMKDENGNGQPDDTWYEIKGSEFDKSEYKRNYSVTYYRPDSPQGDVKWTDNEGNTGYIKRNAYHSQAYYPEWIEESSYTLYGSWLKGKINADNPQYITSSKYDWGYADNSAGGDKIDIDNAVDTNGNKVTLSGVDFIKIQTGVLADMGWLGEQSTEVTGVADISLLNN